MCVCVCVLFFFCFLVAVFTWMPWAQGRKRTQFRLLFLSPVSHRATWKLRGSSTTLACNVFVFVFVYLCVGVWVCVCVVVCAYMYFVCVYACECVFLCNTKYHPKVSIVPPPPRHTHTHTITTNRSLIASRTASVVVGLIKASFHAPDAGPSVLACAVPCSVVNLTFLIDRIRGVGEGGEAAGPRGSEDDKLSCRTS